MRDRFLEYIEYEKGLVLARDWGPVTYVEYLALVDRVEMLRVVDRLVREMEDAGENEIWELLDNHGMFDA